MYQYSNIYIHHRVVMQISIIQKIFRVVLAQSVIQIIGVKMFVIIFSVIGSQYLMLGDISCPSLPCKEFRFILFLHFFFCGKIHITITILTMLKCKVQWYEIHPHFCVAITTIHPQNTFHFVSLNKNSSYSLLPAPGNHQSSFCLFYFDYSVYFM